MRHLGSCRCGKLLGVLALVLGARVAGAQSFETSRPPMQHGDSAADAERLAPADHLSGRARVGVSASAEHLDIGISDTYALGAGVAPFFGEHLQLGIAPMWRDVRNKVGPASQTEGSTIAARYVFGGDPHWRGFVGAFGGAWHAPSTNHGDLFGAQLGTLYFLTPALAIRTEVDVRRGAYYFQGQPRFTEFLVILDPYVSGAADDVPVTPATFGTVDVAGEYVYERFHLFAESGIAGTIAPYLTRWAQIGAEGEADGSSREITAHRLRGFGRLYLPITVRTQPFAEGFAETSTYNGEDGGLSSFGGAVGVRRMLNGNVALDVGVQRRLHPRERLGSGNLAHWYREWGSTSLVIGMMTRIGRAH